MSPPAGKRNLPPGATCAKRRISLTPRHDRILAHLMERSGKGRSTIVQMLIDDGWQQLSAKLAEPAAGADPARFR